MKLFLFISLLVFSTAPVCHSMEYGTWETMEPDKCAAAWLIKRFVDQEAIFKFYPNGELISSGIPFDTPEAELRLYQNMSTFERVLEKYNLTEPVLLEMGKIFHDIEINFWGQKNTEKSNEVKKAIRSIIDKNSDPNKILELSFHYFDTLYNDLKRIGL